MHKKVRKILAVLCFAVLLSVGVYSVGSLSYLQDHDGTVNQLTVDSNESAVTESFTKPGNLNNGTLIQKDVRVTNTGDVACYGRVRVLPAAEPDAYTFNFDTAHWTRDSSSVDCWWYYNEPIDPGESTTSLFTTATLKEDLNGLNADDAQIIVYEETAQAYGYSSAQAAFR